MKGVRFRPPEMQWLPHDLATEVDFILRSGSRLLLQQLLQDKLESTRDEVGGKKIDLVNETVAEVLRECEMCLLNLTRRIKAAEDEKKRNRMTSMSSEEKKDDKMDDDFNNIMSSFEYNQRIDLDDEEDMGRAAADGARGNWR